MNYWILIATDHKTENVTAEDILKVRLTDKFWGIGERTPNRRSLRNGDKVVFYQGSSLGAFVAIATLISDCFRVSQEEKGLYGHGQDFFKPDFGVLFDDIRVLEPPQIRKKHSL